MLALIEEDRRGAYGDVRIILLGDYIDRGLYSRQIIDFLNDWQEREGDNLIFLMGNHEQVMRDIIYGKRTDLMENWLRFGGRETLLSYGIRPVEEPQELVKELIGKLPASHAEFLDKLPLSATFGDYFFCHAGVRPGVSLDRQEEQDLVWIRHEFLDYRGSFGKVVVHGHTISPDVEFRGNRIGIDTGAYATGRLTALALEGTKQWLIQTG